jgi:glycosyltransferase involved in cell wall biosynthesis
MPRVSIVIPCFNAGRLLVEAVETALAQTHADTEVVIVDDGSTDAETVRLLRDSQWPRTRIIAQSNAGPAVARNVAITEATGEYILPLDADDKIAPTYVEKALAAMEKQPEVGIVYCKAMKFGAEDGPWGLPVYTLRELVIDNVIFVTSLFRKEDWSRVGGFNEKLRYGVEDYEFWVKIVNLGRQVIQLDEYLFFYRIQPQSRTTGFSRDRAAMVSTYAEIFRANVDFYARNAEYLFEHRFGLYDQLEHYRHRYGRLDAYLERSPRLRKLFAYVARMMKLL